MSNKIGVFCPTLNVYGGGEFVAIAIANTLAQNNRDVILFSSDKINPNNIKKYFGETPSPKHSPHTTTRLFYSTGYD